MREKMVRNVNYARTSAGEKGKKLTWPFRTDVWFQTSRCHCRVARLPRGWTGKEALAQAFADAGGDPQEAARWDEGSAGDYFLRCYAEQYGLHGYVEDSYQFREFKRNNGDTYNAAYFHDFWRTPMEQLADVGEEAEWESVA